MNDAVCRQRVEGTVYRTNEEDAILQLRAESIIDEENRIVEFSFSSEHPVERFSWWEEPWIEVLGHKDGEVDLARLLNGAPLLYNHMRTRSERVGKVEKAWLEKGLGMCRVRFSKRADIEDIWSDVRDGILVNVSVAYRINERVLVKANKDGYDEYRVTSWTPMEISVVDIPADHTVGIGRDGAGAAVMYRVIDLEIESARADATTGKAIMSDKDKRTPNPGAPGNPEPPDRTEPNPAPAPAPAPSPEPTPRAEVVNIDDARREGARLEAERQREIREMFSRHSGHEELLRTCLEDVGCTADAASRKLVTALGADVAPAGQDSERGSISFGRTEHDNFRDGVTLAIVERGNLFKPEERKSITADNGGNFYRGFTMCEMARHALELKGIDTKRMSRMDLVARAFTSSDFPLILQNIANKAMMMGYEEAAETWMLWAQVGSLSDFKVASRVNLSSFDALKLIPEHGEYKYGTIEEEGETIQLATYGAFFGISRQTIVNDDLSALTVIPRKMGRASNRTVGDVAYAALTANPTMADGNALFSAAHGNLASGADLGAPSVTTLGKARRVMALQKDKSESAHGLNIRIGGILVPIALEDTTRQVVASTYDPRTTVQQQIPNPVKGIGEVIPEPRLDADSETAWYATADKNSFDTVEVGFLDGNQAPTLEEKQGWNIDGVEYKVRIDVGVAPKDHRTLYKNPGA